ncbi:EamA/RhaT family transporter [Cryomorphaceae bacterium 1068]|nr:EamA/RhaT family transporter [Cryomorphaceae bacterium 1068]
MIYLLLSIICSTAIYAIFSLFGKYKIDTFQAIVVNYFVASGFGFWYTYSSGGGNYTLAEPWLINAVIVGVLFITLFYIMAITSQRHGVTVTGIATKMSMVIPVFFFLIADEDESWHWAKLTGIILGIIAVLLTTLSGKKKTSLNLAALTPIVLFVGSGLLDLFLALTEKNYLTSDIAYTDFVPVPFGIAATIGTIILIYRGIVKRSRLRIKNIVAGLILGLVNYGSIYFLLRILGSGLIDRSAAIPANNMGVVALSAIVGISLFKEKLSPRKLWGILLALVAIAMLTLLSP